MIESRLLAVGAFGASIAFVTLALAQANAGHRAAPHSRPAAWSIPDAAAPVPPSAQPAPASVAATPTPVPAPGDAAPPPPPPAEGADGGRFSPLTPAPNEFSDAGAPASSLDYDRLLADIASLRARVAAVSDTLFHSRIAVTLEADGSHARIASLTVSLDDGIVWTSPAAFRADGPTVIYERAVAPGHHAVSVDAERRDDRSEVFRSMQRSRFIVDVPSDQQLAVSIKLSDDSNMGGDFPSSRSGEYSLAIRMSAKAQPAGR